MIHTKEFRRDDGSKSIWFYDPEKARYGPWKVEIEYATLSFEEEQDLLPLKKRKYKHPETGKILSYKRALSAGIITSDGKILPYVHTNKKNRRIKEKGNTDIMDTME